ncbi:hypothetical protein [Methylobacterium sp. J-090]|uniref:hypothetical protein n=1 Tax=Methylobacterium sp. J-090 TaxID=2836666 RepID=UPI001FBB7281|nr:hypothetical protein [Methylobacterium sp. J-090]MCJ2079890.1 hypothetical protein [Methylobacterium sp. J-090]
MNTPQLTRNIFNDMTSLKGFSKAVQDYYIYLVDGTGIKLTFDDRRMAYAHEFWNDDINALPRRMKSGDPDHFKKSGFLAFWLRREPPIMCWDDRGVEYDSLPKSIAFQVDYLKTYGREYGAFMLGYSICRHFESTRNGGAYDGSRYDLTQKYVDDMMFFMKRMNVSPHALFMIYESLFMRTPKF